MTTTKLISNFTAENIDELKIALLYFDKIELVNNQLIQVEQVDKSKKGFEKGDIGIVRDIRDFITSDYARHIEKLVRNKVVSITTEDYSKKDELSSKILSTTYQILSENQNLLFDITSVRKDALGNDIGYTLNIPKEVTEVYSTFLGEAKVGKSIDLEFIQEYYAVLLSSLLFHISTGSKCLTSSDILNKLLAHFITNNQFQELYKTIQAEDISNHLAINAIKLSVPNISIFPFEEVLEVKEKAKTELEKFKDELSTFQFNLLENYSQGEILSKSDEIIKHKLNPSLNDLNRKVINLDLKLPKQVLDEFKDPKSYTPLLGSILGTIPTTIAALLSLGIISFSTAYDYIINKKEIKENGLYYLIKLKRHFS